MAINRYYSATAQDTALTAFATSSTTAIVVGATTGFPTSYPYVLALDYGASAEELVSVTGAAGLTLSVSRAFNGTANVAHNVGAVVRHVIVAQDMTEMQAHIAATGAVHGITGSAATFLANPTSANFQAAVLDETGSGSLVFGTAPTLSGTVVVSGDINLTATNAQGSLIDQLTLMLMGAL
jgi:hypothetical protein